MPSCSTPPPHPKSLILAFCIIPLCLSASLPFHNFLLSSPLFFSAPYHSLSSFSSLLSVAPLSSLWSDSVPLFRQGYHHVLPIVTYFPCSLLGITASAFFLPTHTHIYTHTPCPNQRLYVPWGWSDKHGFLQVLCRCIYTGPRTPGSMLYLPSHLTQTNEQCPKSDYLLSSHCTAMAVIKSQEEGCERVNEEGPRTQSHALEHKCVCPICIAPEVPSC